nr:DUF29 domain-containing protein [Petrachloros mirabilis]
MNDLYEQDYAQWLEVTLSQLKDQDLANLDWQHLIEAIEDLGREQKNKLESYLRQLLKHLLLYQYWEKEKPYCARGWAEEIDNFRSELEILLRSQTLYNYLLLILEPTYQKARRSAVIKSGLEVFPKICPYEVNAILDTEWLP